MFYYFRVAGYVMVRMTVVTTQMRPGVQLTLVTAVLRVMSSVTTPASVFCHLGYVMEIWVGSWGQHIFLSFNYISSVSLYNFILSFQYQL